MRQRGEMLAARALDPNVSQEVLKLTIAYKAETNVVDIVPQAKRLRLSLNMPFAELDDPRGIAKNVAGVGRWGNGEVEFGVASLGEIPYALALIRQSLELRWVPFIGQFRPLTSLTPGGRNRARSQCRPHGEFCLPGRCEALHGSTSTESGPG